MKTRTLCGLLSAAIFALGFVGRNLLLMPVSILDMSFAIFGLPVAIFFPESDVAVAAAVFLAQVAFAYFLGMLIGAIAGRHERTTGVAWTITAAVAVQVFGLYEFH